MLIKTSLIAAIAALGLTGAALADGSKAPTILDDQALDSIMAGTTFNQFPAERFFYEIDVPYETLENALTTANISSDSIYLDYNSVYIY